MLARALLCAVCLILAGVLCSPAFAQCPGGRCNVTFRPAARSQVVKSFLTTDRSAGWYLGKNLGRKR